MGALKSCRDRSDIAWENFSRWFQVASHDSKKFDLTGSAITPGIFATLRPNLERECPNPCRTLTQCPQFVRWRGQPKVALSGHQPRYTNAPSVHCPRAIFAHARTLVSSIPDAPQTHETSSIRAEVHGVHRLGFFPFSPKDVSLLLQGSTWRAL